MRYKCISSRGALLVAEAANAPHANCRCSLCETTGWL